MWRLFPARTYDNSGLKFASPPEEHASLHIPYYLKEGAVGILP
jgi:hypothetical protein